MVANPESLPLGWKKQASYSFALLNQSGEELYRTPESCKLFRPQFTGWGSPKAFTLQKLQDMGYLENKLILKVDVKVIESVDEGAVTGNDMLDVRGSKSFILSRCRLRSAISNDMVQSFLDKIEPTIKNYLPYK
ncbi:hypothetical protein F2Q68_00031524 [Brassica cretica]|uniref:MATH domain-containing protein n=1 Tax=Brassica cretica TaxID=69181 RepID=A0A8S9GGH2_BRACR|nr:hypothetical protein F2Q68_00031524 [Brassica cretica]